MLKFNVKRQRIDVPDNSDGSNLRNALNHFDSNYNGFLQNCMKKAGFSALPAMENDETFFVITLKALGMDIKKAKELDSLFEHISSYEIEYSNKMQSYWNVIKDSEAKDARRISRVLELYNTESHSFRKLCMFLVGYNSSKVSENSEAYVTFMLRSVDLVIKHLHDMEPESKNMNGKALANAVSNKAEDIIRNFLTSTSKKTSSSIKFVKSSTHFTIYRISKDGSNYALKVLNKTPDGNNAQSLENEINATQHFIHPDVRKFIEKTTYESKPALTLEWFDGLPVEEIGKFKIEEFMIVARQIASAIDALHSKNINHLNITTANILVNMQKRSVKIIGFTSSTKYETIKYTNGNQKRLEKDSKFIPPEQTGCINLHVDLRSDLYDIGMVYYFMLIGNFPFGADNKSQLVHNSLFSYISPLNLIDMSVPNDLSNLVLKLLEKDPANRYQSAKGISYDLDLIHSKKKGETFRLAEQDFSSKLLIFHKLYGRSLETKELNAAFEKACEGSLEVVLINGSSGTGKSELAYELLASVTRKNGIFIHGKYEASTLTEPYSGIISAFNRFCDLILLEGSSVISYYRSKILDAVGEEGKILLNLVPKLKQIIGQQTESVEVTGFKAKNRLDYICCNFLRAICAADRPLVFLLDDLHRADEDSFPFLSALLSDKCLKNVLFIGTYHPDKVDKNHPFTNTIEVMRQNKVSLKHIELGNLSNDQVNNLVADTVRRSHIETIPLTAFVTGHTEGKRITLKLQNIKV